MKANFSPSVFLTSLFPWHSCHIVEQVAGEVARECRNSVWQRVYHRTANMSLAEIRGYVRAQAKGFVDDEVERAIHRRHLKAKLRRRLIDASVDQLVVMVAHDVLASDPPVRTKALAA